MKKYQNLYLYIIILLIIIFNSLFTTTCCAGNPDSFRVSDGKFLLNDSPFVIKAAELHYPRIPRPYWDQRIKMCKALGMNTICLYVFWNFHEDTPGNFDFTGQKDLREFIKLCADNDMKVILRPGPYVCAEWEMGGLPWWLLKKKDIRLREEDPYFMERVDLFQKAVAEQVRDLTIDEGGPIIMIQVENEYGSYGTDKSYVGSIRDILKKNYGDDTAMFQCDWSSNFLNNGLDDLIWTINFGTGADIEQQFAPLKEARPDAPLMCSEFWSGWFDKWGAAHETRPAEEMIKGIEDMLQRNISFSLYMTHGGTNWGHWAGANSPGFAPDVTSYDYDAPIDEAGNPTPKYLQLRNLLSRYSENEELSPVPDSIPSMRVEKFRLTEYAPLFNNLPESRRDSVIRTMEEYDNGFGSIIYTTVLPEIEEGSILTVNEPHDYARIYIDGKYIGKLDRRHNEKELTLPYCPEGKKLSILVEAMGRINFGKAIKDYKGITENVILTTFKEDKSFMKELDDWQIHIIPDSLNFYESFNFIPLTPDVKRENGRLPEGVYKGSFYLKDIADTYLNFETWGKGLVYVNGHPLGRIWNIGPQQTLYMPGCWLREGENDILIFDVMGPEEAVTEGLEKPVLDKLRPDEKNNVRESIKELPEMKEIYAGNFPQGNGWKKIIFPETGKGKYVTLTMKNAYDGGSEAAIAEIYLLDEEGSRIPRESWRPLHTDSHKQEGNHTADKAFDLQESTYWQSLSGSFPHTMTIDLGKDYTIGGIEYLPRMEPGNPSAVDSFTLSINCR